MCLQGVKNSLSDSTNKLSSWTFTNSSVASIYNLQGFACWNEKKNRRGSFPARFQRVWSISRASKSYISPTTPSPVQSFLKSVTGYASLHPCEPNDESQALWSPRSVVCGPIFALWFSVVQFHRSGVCGLIFAIWFSVGLDCGLCTLGFWFSLSWLLVLGFWFLCSLGLDFYVLLGFVSIFIFLCLLLFMLFDLVIFMFFFWFDVHVLLFWVCSLILVLMFAGFISWFKKNIEEQVLMFLDLTSCNFLFLILLFN